MSWSVSFTFFWRPVKSPLQPSRRPDINAWISSVAHFSFINGHAFAKFLRRKNSVFVPVLISHNYYSPFLFLCWGQLVGPRFCSHWTWRTYRSFIFFPVNKHLVMELIAAASLWSADTYSRCHPHSYGNIHWALWWRDQVVACIVRTVMDQGSSLVGPHSCCHGP